MKKNLLFLILWLLLSILNPPLQALSAETHLTLNTFTGPPLSTKDRTGLYDLIIIKAFGRIGINITISHLPAERSIINANLGLDDGDFVRISGLHKTYPNLIQVPEKIADYQFTAFTKNTVIQLESWKSLNPYHIGIVRGWKILENNLQDVAKLIKVKNQHLLFNMLDKERLDIIIYSKLEGYWIAKKYGYLSIKTLEPPLATREMFLYLNKTHTLLVPRLDRAIKDMKTDGTFDQIMFKALSP